MSDEARNEVIRRWLVARDNAAKWNEEERRLRDFIAAQFGYRPDAPAQSIHLGTHRMDLGNGYKLKLVTSERVDVKDGPELDRFLTAMRSYSGGPAYLDRLLKFKPSLAKRAYEEARTEAPAVYTLLSPAVERKPAAPTLELEKSA